MRLTGEQCRSEIKRAKFGELDQEIVIRKSKLGNRNQEFEIRKSKSEEQNRDNINQKCITHNSESQKRNHISVIRKEVES